MSGSRIGSESKTASSKSLDRSLDYGCYVGDKTGQVIQHRIVVDRQGARREHGTRRLRCQDDGISRVRKAGRENCARVVGSDDRRRYQKSFPNSSASSQRIRRGTNSQNISSGRRRGVPHGDRNVKRSTWKACLVLHAFRDKPYIPNNTYTHIGWPDKVICPFHCPPLQKHPTSPILSQCRCRKKKKKKKKKKVHLFMTG
eukprot:TRINITY_DN1998_c0_g1_i4.p1 TRINITY_DN1998_c0_g1~~TRINITY_DN1998_c0_g1_i4.p1  ORF type:complete len:200 (+),score=11.47 TRINITY_DN1998_c0_g1_i4:329-928(+)